MLLNAPHHKQQEYIYGLGVGIWKVSEILCNFWNEGVGHAPGAHPWAPRSMSLNAPYHKEQEYIWFMGEDLNGFWDITRFMKRRGWGMPPGTPGVPRSMSLNAPYHKEQEHIWFVGEDLNGFWAIIHLIRGWDMPPGDLGVSQGPCH